MNAGQHDAVPKSSGYDIETNLNRISNPASVTRTSAREFLESLTKMESHNSRASTTKLYLEPTHHTSCRYSVGYGKGSVENQSFPEPTYRALP